MFERFTREARDAVTLAQTCARELGHAKVGTEDLLLALLRLQASVSRQVLAAHGIDHDTALAAVGNVHPPDDLDPAALEAIGIDLDAVRQKVEAAFGEGALEPERRGRGGHIPFSPRSKKTLELSLREALRLKHRHIADGHILLGILRDGEGLAAKVLADAGVDFDALRRDLEQALTPGGR